MEEGDFFDYIQGREQQGGGGGGGTCQPDDGGPVYATEDVEAALERAEALLGLPLGGTAASGAGTYPQQSNQPAGDQFQHPLQQQQQAGGWHSSNCVRTELTAEVPPRPLSAWSLGEQAMSMRITLHEKEMELLQLRAQCQQLAEGSAHTQQQLEAALAERDSRIARLEEGLSRREQAVANLTASLQAYGKLGLTPETAAALQADHAALQARCTELGASARAADAAAAEAAARQADAARRVHEGVATWERLQAELQVENARLAGALARAQAELADLFQEKEVLRAKVAMLEARAGSGFCLSSAPGPGPSLPTAAPEAAGTTAAVAGAPAELRQQLAEALQRLEARDATARRYKEAVRALKRRVGELEQALGQQAAAGAAAAAEAATAQGRAAGEAAAAAAALAQCEQQLAEVRQQCEQYSSRLAQVDAQLKKAEFERAQWECRAQDAEQRAQAAGEAAEASTAAAARLGERQRALAEGRVADVEAQAKAASLRVLQLEKQLARTQQEIEALRQQQSQAAARQPSPELQSQHDRRSSSATEQLLLQQLRELRSQLATAARQHTTVEQELRGQLRSKAAALTASDKKLRLCEAVVRRLAGKHGGSSGGKDACAVGAGLCV